MAAIQNTIYIFVQTKRLHIQCKYNKTNNTIYDMMSSFVTNDMLAIGYSSCKINVLQTNVYKHTNTC